MIGGHTRGSAQYQGRALHKPPGRVAPRWRRGTAQFARVAGLTLGITAVTLTAPVIGEVVVNSPMLAVRTIHVTGTHLLTPTQVTRAAGLSLGMPAISVSPRAVIAELLRSPRIAQATVERGWGGAVRIAIIERQGIAMVSTSFDDSAAAPLVVAGDGVLLDPLGPQECADLPFLTGLEAPHMHAGDRIAAARFRPIASLLTMMRRPDIALTAEISSVDLAAGDTLWLTTLRNGSRVLLPQRTITVDDLSTLRGILDDCEKQHLPAQKIDMTFKDMVVLDPADPMALQRQAREHRLEEQHLAADAQVRQAAADSLARLATLVPQGPRLPREFTSTAEATTVVAQGRGAERPSLGVYNPRRPAPTSNPQRGPRRASHASSPRHRTAAGDGPLPTTSHRSLPQW